MALGKPKGCLSTTPPHKRAWSEIQKSIVEIRDHKTQQTRVYPYPLGAGSARPNPKMGAPDPENPLFLGFSVLRGGIETMVSEGARPWGTGRSGDCQKHNSGRIYFRIDLQDYIF